MPSFLLAPGPRHSTTYLAFPPGGQQTPSLQHVEDGTHYFPLDSLFSPKPRVSPLGSPSQWTKPPWTTWVKVESLGSSSTPAFPSRSAITWPCRVYLLYSLKRTHIFPSPLQVRTLFKSQCLIQMRVTILEKFILHSIPEDLLKPCTSPHEGQRHVQIPWHLTQDLAGSRPAQPSRQSLSLTYHTPGCRGAKQPGVPPTVNFGFLFCFFFFQYHCSEALTRSAGSPSCLSWVVILGPGSLALPQPTHPLSPSAFFFPTGSLHLTRGHCSTQPCTSPQPLRLCLRRLPILRHLKHCSDIKKEKAFPQIWWIAVWMDKWAKGKLERWIHKYAYERVDRVTAGSQHRWERMLVKVSAADTWEAGPRDTLSQAGAGRACVGMWWCKSWGQLIVASKATDYGVHSNLQGRHQMSLFRVLFDFWKDRELRQGVWEPTESIQWAAFQGRHCFGTRGKLTSSAKCSELKEPSQPPTELRSLWAWAAFPYLNLRRLISWNLDGMLAL